MTESNLGAIILLTVSILAFTPLGLSIHTSEHDIIKACILTIPYSEDSSYKYVYKYVNARIKYNPDNLDSIEAAQNWLSLLTHIESNNGKIEVVPDYDGILADEIYAFKKELSERHEICKRKKFEGTIPYVGMEECDLKYTDWGEPYREVTSGFAGEYTRYYFKVDDSICSVVVSDVRNYRNKHNENRVVILEPIRK